MINTPGAADYVSRGCGTLFDMSGTVTNRIIAQAAGIHPTMASRLRTGQRRPSLPVAVAILDALDLDDVQFRAGARAFAESGEPQAEFFALHGGAYLSDGEQ